MNKAKDPLFNIVKRDALPWYKSLGIRLIAILAALIVCAIVTTILTGINPIQVYVSIFLGAFGTARKTWITFQNVGRQLRRRRLGCGRRSDGGSLHDHTGR